MRIIAMRIILGGSIFGFVLIFILVILSVFGCSKEVDNKPKDSDALKITYIFHSESIPYLVSISDITNLNDFQDSIYTKDFSKTITYNYTEAFHCRIDAYSPANMQISIIHNGDTNTCFNSLYSNLTCFIDP